jgi:sugar lactone lactonase YvrE
VSERVVTELEATCVLPARAMLGESPVWSDREAALFWVDIDGQAVHRFDPATGLDETRPAPGRPGSLALTAEAGRLLVAIEERLAFLDWDSAEWADWIGLEPRGSGNRLNDGQTDPAGRFWVGSMFAGSGPRQPSGLLHRIEPDGSTAVVRDGIGVPNGLAFAPDGRTLYFADTHRDTVWAYDYDPSTGEASNERLFLDFATLPGRPDGACVDEDGCYWIACVYGSVVLRVTPTSEIDQRVTLPAPKPTMPAFGGPDMSTLFITTIGGGGSHLVDPAFPDAGGIFAVETNVRGLPQPVFAGGPTARPSRS